MLNVRPVHPDDTPAVLSLIGGIYESYGFRLDTEGLDRHLLAPGPYFRERGGEFWVGERAGAILATVGVLIRPAEAELKALYVHPSMRRQGCGRRLTELTLDYARRVFEGQPDKKVPNPRMILWSDTRFLDAHRLYRKLGFRQTGMRELHDCNDTVEFGFERGLDSASLDE